MGTWTLSGSGDLELKTDTLSVVTSSTNFLQLSASSSELPMTVEVTQFTTIVSRVYFLACKKYSLKLHTPQLQDSKVSAKIKLTQGWGSDSNSTSSTSSQEGQAAC